MCCCADDGSCQFDGTNSVSDLRDNEALLVRTASSAAPAPAMITPAGDVDALLPLLPVASAASMSAVAGVSGRSAVVASNATPAMASAATSFVAESIAPAMDAAATLGVEPAAALDDDQDDDLSLFLDCSLGFLNDVTDDGQDTDLMLPFLLEQDVATIEDCMADYSGEELVRAKPHRDRPPRYMRDRWKLSQTQGAAVRLRLCQATADASYTTGSAAVLRAASRLVRQFATRCQDTVLVRYEVGVTPRGSGSGGGRRTRYLRVRAQRACAALRALRRKSCARGVVGASLRAAKQSSAPPAGGSKSPSPSCQQHALLGRLAGLCRHPQQHMACCCA